MSSTLILDADLFARDCTRLARSQAIRARGWDVSKLAKHLGVSRAMIHYVLKEARHAEWLRVSIVRIIGVDYSVFWGCDEPTELYPSDAKKLRAAGFSA